MKLLTTCQKKKTIDIVSSVEGSSSEPLITFNLTDTNIVDSDVTHYTYDIVFDYDILKNAYDNGLTELRVPFPDDSNFSPTLTYRNIKHGENEQYYLDSKYSDIIFNDNALFILVGDPSIYSDFVLNVMRYTPY